MAMDYFSQCSTHGRQYMMQYIVRVPLETERKAVKVLRVCQRYQLTESGVYVDSSCVFVFIIFFMLLLYSSSEYM